MMTPTNCRRAKTAPTTGTGPTRAGVKGASSKPMMLEKRLREVIIATHFLYQEHSASLPSKLFSVNVLSCIRPRRVKLDLPMGLRYSFIIAADNTALQRIDKRNKIQE